jgi:hypothetical protein
MTEVGYVVWFIVTAIMTATLLTVGTLAADGLLRTTSTPSDPPLRRRGRRRPAGSVLRGETTP